LLEVMKVREFWEPVLPGATAWQKEWLGYWLDDANQEMHIMTEPPTLMYDPNDSIRGVTEHWRIQTFSRI